MTQNYELYFIVDPSLGDVGILNQITAVENLLTIELLPTSITKEIEGLKRLAYPINGHKTGYYVSIKMDIELANVRNISKIEKKFMIVDGVMRYMILNTTDDNKIMTKESLNKSEIRNHRLLNKGRANKICLTSFLGMKVIDFKDIEFLTQFASPYHKIFDKSRTGTSAKMQRKIDTAIKRARHMGLMAFTPQFN
jgi:small subunit ribosomal protein S18